MHKLRMSVFSAPNYACITISQHCDEMGYSETKVELGHFWGRKSNLKFNISVCNHLTPRWLKTEAEMCARNHGVHFIIVQPLIWKKYSWVWFRLHISRAELADVKNNEISTPYLMHKLRMSLLDRGKISMHKLCYVRYLVDFCQIICDQFTSPRKICTKLTFYFN